MSEPAEGKAGGKTEEVCVVVYTRSRHLKKSLSGESRSVSCGVHGVNARAASAHTALSAHTHTPRETLSLSLSLTC